MSIEIEGVNHEFLISWKIEGWLNIELFPPEDDVYQFDVTTPDGVL